MGLKRILCGLILLLLTFGSIGAQRQNEGSISGTLLLDDSWSRNVYLSLIETIENKYAVSNEMIIASSVIDSIGSFSISLADLPADWSLLRLHVVKKGVSPASLIIGSKDENHYFMVANNTSKIHFKNSLDIPVFRNVILTGAPYMDTFAYIDKLSNYASVIDYESFGIEKEFIDQVVTEKLKVIADSCSNPLVSLYALYQFDFKIDFEENSDFYEAYIAKIGKTNNRYFRAFKNQFPAKKPRRWFYVLFVLLVGAVGYLLYFLLGKKRRLLKTLSLQERRIFDLLRTGASNQEIATTYHIEVSTVKSHVGKIYSKLKVSSRKEAILQYPVKGNDTTEQ